MDLPYAVNFPYKNFGIILAIVVVRLLTVREYGDIAFAISVTGLVSVFAGLGSNWSLLRFGPALAGISARFQLLKYALAKGTMYTLPMILLVITASFFLPSNLKDSKYFLIILSVGVLTVIFYTRRYSHTSESLVKTNCIQNQMY